VNRPASKSDDERKVDMILAGVGALGVILALRDGLTLIHEGTAHANVLPLVIRLGIPAIVASGAVRGNGYQRVAMLAAGIFALVQLNISAWQLGFPGIALCLASAGVVTWCGFAQARRAVAPRAREGD
jgi:hypothetical protein